MVYSHNGTYKNKSEITKQQWDTTIHILECPKFITLTIKCWQRYGAVGMLICYWWQCKRIQPHCKAVWQFLTKLNCMLTIQKLYAYYTIQQLCSLIFVQRSLKHVHTKICTWMFVTTLFTTDKTWKQSRCHSVDE